MILLHVVSLTGPSVIVGTCCKLGIPQLIPITDQTQGHGKRPATHIACGPLPERRVNNKGLRSPPCSFCIGLSSRFSLGSGFGERVATILLASW